MNNSLIIDISFLNSMTYLILYMLSTERGLFWIV
jgi:hypothetical protein